MPAIEFVVPGSIESLTGGYIYDRKIVEGLDKLGWHTNVISLDGSFPMPTPDALRHAETAFAGIADGRIVVIDGLALGGLADILAAQTQRLELVALVHHPVSFEIGLYAARAKSLHRSERASLAEVKRVICTSAWTSRALAEYDVAPTLVRIVEPGTEPAEPAQGASGPELNILCVATVTPRKGHAVLIDALDRLRKKPWHLHCVGSTTRNRDCAAALGRQIELLRLTDRITVHGEIPDAALEKRYREADVFVLVSNLEGYGMALAEALAHGIPIITTPCGAIPETVPEGVGLFVPPGDCAALTAALDKLLSSDATRRVFRERALAARSKLPTWDDACARFVRALTGLGTQD
jgi:glycosyltransferase involved in cell wall biosynthesis